LREARETAVVRAISTKPPFGSAGIALRRTQLLSTLDDISVPRFEMFDAQGTRYG
jgi:hypothetical protein